MDYIKMDVQNFISNNNSKLPSLPHVALKIIQEVKQDRSSLSELADIISFDPALTARILKIANSSFYALPNKVESVERAVNIIGLQALKNIALSFVIVQGFRRKNVDDFDYELFWKRAVTAAVSAEVIAAKSGMQYEDIFVTPLLMDIGVLIMYLSNPDMYMKVLNEKKVSRISLIEAEKAAFGFDHAEVGGEILKQWGIPENIYMPIRFHHDIKDCPSEFIETVDLLIMSDESSSLYCSDRSTKKFSKLKELLQEKINITEAEVREFIDSIAEKALEVLSAFEIDSGDMKPYSQILEEANEELGKLNLSYEQLVMELKQAKEKAEALAIVAMEAKEKLRELALKDGLTGLYNHRYFKEILDKEMERAERYSHVISLIMIDIDDFKPINDTYGHQQGDTVLRSIAELFLRTVRRPDTPVRYGGEEFVIILPETDMKGAVTLAERLRLMVEKIDIRFEKQTLKITVSMGVVCYDPGNGRKDKKEIIELADKALYNSKKTGKNRISLMSSHNPNNS